MKLTRTLIFVYFFVLIFSPGCQKKDSPTKPPPIILPDTTSHNFTWQIELLGDGNSSRLKDVCIIDENDVWAVGEIYLKDSTGEFMYPPYGAAVWNGSTWEVRKLKTRSLDYETYLNPLGVFAFTPEDIWFAHGGIHHFNGQDINSYWVNWFPGNVNAILDSGQSIDKIWGQSSSNLWAVGRQGAIVHYNGTSWQKIESGTTQPINDIWGIYNQKTQEQKIYCVASDKYHGGEKKIFQIIKNEAIEVNWSPQRAAHSVWFLQNTPLYVCGSGVFMYDNNQWSQIEGVPNIFKNRIRGNHQYDIFIAGDFGLLTHYNGRSWYIYEELTLPNGNYESLAIKDNLVVAVGWQGDKAVVCRGIRNK